MNSEQIKGMTDSEIFYAAADLRATISCQEEMIRAGNVAPKLPAYWDSLYALDAEIRIRRGV